MSELDPLVPLYVKKLTEEDADNIKSIPNIKAGVKNAKLTDSPIEGIDTYNVSDSGTYTNFDNIIITIDDLNEGLVQIRRNLDGSWEKTITPLAGFNLESFGDNKNLIDDSYITVGYISATGPVNSSDADWRRTKKIPIQQGESYVFTATDLNVEINKNLNFYSYSDAFLLNIKINTLPFYFNTPEESCYLIIDLGDITLYPTPSILSLFYQSDYDSISGINSRSVSASSLINSDTTRDFFETVVLATSGVKINKSNNIFDINKISIGYVTGGGSLNNDDIEWKKVLISNLKQGIYTLSVDNDGFFFPSGSKNICFFNENGVFLENIKVTELPFSFPVPTGSDYAYMNIAYIGDGDNLTDINLAGFMLNRGGLPKDLEPFKRPMLKNIFGFSIGFTEQSYQELKLNVDSSKLVAGEKIIVRNAPGGRTIIVTANSANSISKNIEVIESGTQFDFYELDLNEDVIKAYDNIACVIRNTSGIWSFIDDTDHAPKGFSAVSQNDDSVILSYEKNYTKVKSLIATPDETYTQFGVFGVGCSVGLDSAFLKLSCEGIYGEFKEIDGSLSIIQSGFKNAVKEVNMAVGGEITVVHSQTAGLIAIIISNNPNHFYKNTNTESLTQTKFKCYDSTTGAQITDEVDLSFIFSRPGGRLLKHNESDIMSSNIWVQGLMLTEFN